MSGRRLIPQVAILLERLKDDALQVRRQIRPQLARPEVACLVQNRDESQRHGICLERRLAVTIS